jgi:predicted dehydrogenase
VRVVVIGFGVVAETTHLPAFARAGFDVVAVADPSPERRARAREVLPRARIGASLDEALDGIRADVADVATPPAHHFAAAGAAIGRGLHVLVEKPIVLREEDGAALARMAAAGGVVVCGVRNWLYGELHGAVRRALAEGEIGRPIRVELETLRTRPAVIAGPEGVPGAPVNWRLDPGQSGGGVMFDHGWHLYSLAQAFLGERPASVSATMERRRFRGMPVEDTVDCLVRFPRATARLFATWAADARDNRGRIDGTEGSIEMSADRLVVRGRRGEREERFAESLAAGGYRPGWIVGVLRELREEVEHPELRGRSLAESRRCLAICRLAYRSAEGNGVEIPCAGP